ncbi:hypothetical protein ABW19_dt0208140 [Dactylella cylindrospora]|nr:hypothetical protein ABW19_dt0208140 [Dactylella cylindrospora]
MHKMYTLTRSLTFIAFLLAYARQAASMDKWESTDCWLGIYDLENFQSENRWHGDFWEMQPPLGECVTPESRWWSDRIDSYRVGGDCLCEFFDQRECQSKLFDAFNRGDHSLKSHGMNNNKISSWRCTKIPGASCRVQFYEEGAGAPAITEDPLFHTVPGTCWTVPEELRGKLAGYRLQNCQCDFYKTTDCTEPGFMEDMHHGKMNDTFPLFDDVLSYKCHYLPGMGK